MSVKPIRVMIVDDSIFFREFMSRSLATDFSIEVVGAVSSASEAIQKIPGVRPNILTLDIEAPGLNYRDYIKKIRQTFPYIQIIVVSPLNANLFDALKAGAVDFVAKPGHLMKMDNASFLSELMAKIKTVYSGAMPVAVPASVSAMAGSGSTRPSAPRTPGPPGSRPQPVQSVYSFPNAGKRVIAIGASTGGTEAIVSVIKDLPANTPGIVIVQHMPPVFTKMFAERLNSLGKMAVREARHGDRVQPGLILVAEGDQHMRLAGDALGYFVKVEEGEKVSGHCPSVDVLFESVANVAGPNAVGVLLTGMGGDGAKNLLRMRERGAYTIGQDEATSVVYGMPMVAYNLGAVVDQLPLGDIPGAMLRYLSR